MIVPPNALVKAGQPVLTFEDIKVRNELEQAAREAAGRQAPRLDRRPARPSPRPEAGPRNCDACALNLRLPQAAYNYARDIMSKSQIAAPAAAWRSIPTAAIGKGGP